MLIFIGEVSPPNTLLLLKNLRLEIILFDNTALCAHLSAGLVVSLFNEPCLFQGYTAHNTLSYG